MKMKFSRSSCTVSFEDFDKFAGKEVRMEGELVTGGFDFHRDSLRWLVWSDEKGLKQMKRIDNETILNQVIDYMIAESDKKGFKLQLW